MSAIIAMPVDIDESVKESVTLEWTGVVRKTPLIVANDRYPTTPEHPALADLWSPAHLGRALVEAYWAMGADIQRWWDHFIGEHLGDDDLLLATDRSYPIGVQWAYIGAQRGLHIVHCTAPDRPRGRKYRPPHRPPSREVTWYVGGVTWDEDPATVQLDTV